MALRSGCPRLRVVDWWNQRRRTRPAEPAAMTASRGSTSSPSSLASSSLESRRPPIRSDCPWNRSPPRTRAPPVAAISRSHRSFPSSGHSGQAPWRLCGPSNYGWPRWRCPWTAAVWTRKFSLCRGSSYVPILTAGSVSARAARPSGKQGDSTGSSPCDMSSSEDRNPNELFGQVPEMQCNGRYGSSRTQRWLQATNGSGALALTVTPTTAPSTGHQLTEQLSPALVSYGLAGYHNALEKILVTVRRYKSWKM